MKKQINNEVVDMTSEEISQREADIANMATKEQEQATAKAEQDALKASGNQKFLDMGLTQAEATALTGYTPPVAE